ncbi:MAG: glycosyltransferase [Flavobacteriales bacterium]|nr:glycosyltransferase [Flavobacteriales bacterium]
MMGKIDVIITGLKPWDADIGGNCKNIAQTFSKNRRVLFIDPPLDRITSLRGRGTKQVQGQLEVIKGRRSNLRMVNDNLWVFTPPVILESMNWLPSFLFRMANRMNGIRFARAINQVKKQLKFSDFILFSDSDMFRSKHLSELLRPSLFVYYTRDNLMTVPYWAKHGSVMEPEIIKSADLVVANSPHLADLARENNSNSYYVGQGCDLSQFKHQQVNEPKDLARIKGVKIGYVGLLSSRRLNLDLLKDLAAAKPEWQVVLVGPEEDSFKNSELHQMDNVHFLGSKKMEELPLYIQYFDICINPQIVNDLTIGNYPRKIDEYLAMGKPIIATDTPTMKIFEDHVYLGETAEDYIRLIEKAIVEDNESKQKERIHFAQSHTWENNIKEIENAINRVA